MQPASATIPGGHSPVEQALWKRYKIVGSWGIGFFENDDAIDLLYHFTHSNDVTVLRRALLRATDPSRRSFMQLDGPESYEVLAAAELIACGLGIPHRQSLDIELLRQWYENHKMEVDDGDIALCNEAIDNVLSDSELMLLRLPQSSPVYRTWYEMLQQLKARLRQGLSARIDKRPLQ